MIGEHHHTLDEKGRLMLPAEFRPALAGGLVVTRGLEGCLYVFPLATWRRLEAALTELPANNPRAVALARFFIGAALQTRPDRAGRIALTPQLLDYAELEHQGVVLGLKTRLELWNPERWDTELTRLSSAQYAVPEPVRALLR
ncbi:division/cell wall cluster transcriptional repressor MraZ [uncultured Meiothermus sp.]|uniref:division/cell wall cluster transcriptional repressor MraZ n=1 Tax=uncultured Meiothermus sp. TaxID=157471 RepID=UPI002623011B|nr:division/cell wall cluster transcriptional repressor MraZ [uncultured Meiothermus sp.]